MTYVAGPLFATPVLMNRAMSAEVTADRLRVVAKSVVLYACVRSRFSLVVRSARQSGQGQ